ncbi:hypothetical protein NSQ59_07500 [Margalitia sp. FSL K6-0131]|uniref:phage tail protein n=1 Tax=Margalitia sp. FSL K6-0131 TaxID=2954604 RepID=UPI0030F507B2
MADRIKGITIEIGSDTVGLQNALKDVNKQSRKLQTELKDVERLLKYDPGNVELLAQKQQLLTERIEATSNKLNQLKEAQSQVQAQFERGEIGAEQYRAFQREITATEGALNGLRNQLSNMEKEQERVASSTRQLNTLFEATGTSVDQFADSLGNQLTNAIRNGTATSRQLDQAIERIGREALGANVDLGRLRNALSSVDDGASLRSVRQDLNRLSQEADNAEESVKGLGSEIGGLAAGLAAGGGIAGAVEKSLSNSELKTKIDITFDVPKSSIESVRQAVTAIEAYGVDGEAALEGVRRQWALNKTESDEANASIVKGAAVISQSYSGVDFTELIQETNELASGLKISNQDALALTNALLKAGFPPEQLDTIAEYGVQMKQIGFSTKEIQAIFEKGIDVKSWNVDNLNDGVKEARLQMAGFGAGVDKAMNGLIKQSGISVDKFIGWGKAVAEGGKKGSKAMSEVATWLDGIKDKTLKNQLATKVFGTKWEDQGPNMIAVFKGIADAQDKTKQNQKLLNEAISKFDANPAVQMKQAMTELTTALQPLLTTIAGVISKIAEWVSNNPVLTATIVAVTTAIGILVGIFLTLSPLISGITVALPILGTVFTALTGPIGIIIAAITGLIAIFVSLYKKNEDFRNKVNEIWSGIKNAFKVSLEFIGNIVHKVMSEITTFFDSQLKKIKDFWRQNGDSISKITKSFLNICTSVIKSGMGIIKGVFQAVWPILSGVVKIAWGVIRAVISTGVNLVLGIIRTMSRLLQGDWKGAWESIKKTASNIWKDIVKIFKSINLVQIGKNIINGLIKGIKSMISAVSSAAKSIGKSVKNAFLNFFDIHSPSRVMRDEVGYWITEGLAKGIKANTNAEKAAKEKAQAIVKTYKNKLKELDTKYNAGMISTKSYVDSLKNLQKTYGSISGATTTIQSKIAKAQTKQAEKEQKERQEKQRKLAKSFNDEMSKLSYQYNAGILSDEAYIKKLNAMKSKYDNVTNATVKIDAKIADIKKKQIAERFKDDKAYYTQKSKDANVSMQQELDILNKLSKGYKKNSDERIYFENLAKEKKQEIAEAKKKIDEDYLSKVQELNQKYIDEEKKLTEAYQKAVDDRAKSLYSFAGLFDEISLNAEISGEQLLANLQGQVTTFEQWQNNIAALAARGVDEGLIKELQEMGPKSSAEIAALNTLSDEQLAQYVDLWKQKSNLARTEAISELEGMRIDTANQIVALQEETAKQLAAYQAEWKSSMKKVVGNAKNMQSQMPSIGANAVQGLIDGINSRKAALEAAAAELAKIVAGTVQSDLDIHSPSRVFKGFGINVNEGFIQGLQQSAARLKNTMQDVYGSLANSAQKVMQSSSTVTNNSRTIDNSKAQNNNIVIQTTESPERALRRELDRLAFKF